MPPPNVAPIAIPPPASPNIQPPTPLDEFVGPLDPNCPSPGTSLNSAHLSPLPSPTFAPPSSSPPEFRSNLNASSPATARRPSTTGPNPFNFQPMMAAKGPAAPKPNQRRGHKYKHSSVSHQIFLEPPVRAPLALPASLPVPTWNELFSSASQHQRSRCLWCIFHFLVVTFTLWSAESSLALTALSHLILFDAMGATVCVAVDVLSNFEVWKRSSIRHPFGLERAEVLAGFAMSVFLLFMGFDIISHAAEHIVEAWSADTEHLHEEHLARVSPGSIDLAALAALFSTTVSAVVLQNHARIGRAMQFAALSHLPGVLSNPSHLLTLACSAILLLLPLFSLPIEAWLDRTLALTMAGSMIAIGVRLVKVLGSMLLMSYGGGGVQSVVNEIADDPNVKEIQEARFWQAHHGLCIAVLKVVVAVEGEGRIRDKVGRLVRERLGKAGARGERWEVSIAITTV